MDDAPAPKLRWYRLTPDRLILGLLAVEVFLLLSQWGRWFDFNQHKGLTVLTAVAVVALMLLLLLVWLVVSLLFRWRFQYCLRSLLLLVVAAAIVCSWLTTEIQRAGKQRAAVAAIRGDGVSVDYVQDPFDVPRSDCPAWLRKLLGEDFFDRLFAATVNNGCRNDKPGGVERI